MRNNNGYRTVHKRLASLILALTVCFVVSMAARVYAAGASVGSFTVSNNAAHTVMVWSAPDVTNLGVGTNGQVLVGSSAADPVFATIGTGTGISTSTGAGTLTINNTGVTSIAAGAGISRDQATGTVTITATGGGNLTVTAKTSNYSVLSGDAGTVFTTTGAGGTVIFTLPAGAAGLNYTFYNDAAQIMEILCPTSNVLQLGGSATTSAGNIQCPATKGAYVKVVATGANAYAAIGYAESWTVN